MSVFWKLMYRSEHPRICVCVRMLEQSDLKANDWVIAQVWLTALGASAARPGDPGGPGGPGIITPETTWTLSVDAYQRWPQQKCLVRWRASRPYINNTSTSRKQTREASDLQWPGLGWRWGQIQEFWNAKGFSYHIRVVQEVREVQAVQQHWYSRKLVHRGVLVVLDDQVVQW